MATRSAPTRYELCPGSSENSLSLFEGRGREPEGRQTRARASEVLNASHYLPAPGVRILMPGPKKASQALRTLTRRCEPTSPLWARLSEVAHR